MAKPTRTKNFGEEQEMKMFDCDICQSAGSVNKWGYCEICGEEFDDIDSLNTWTVAGSTGLPAVQTPVKTAIIAVGQDAA